LWHPTFLFCETNQLLDIYLFLSPDETTCVPEQENWCTHCVTQMLPFNVQYSVLYTIFTILLQVLEHDSNLPLILTDLRWKTNLC
jgi:hypothetical protein